MKYLKHLLFIVIFTLFSVSAFSASPTGQGLFIVNTCTNITNPVTNFSYCFNGQSLDYWNGSSWTSIVVPSGPPSGAAGGDLSGTYPNPSVAAVNGIAVSGAPSTGQKLTADSSSTASWHSRPYDVGFNFQGTPTASSKGAITCTRTVSFAANFAVSGDNAAAQASCGSNPAESDTYTVKVAGSSIGTLALSTGCALTATTTGGTAQSCTVGQRLEIDAPGTVSGADISLVIAGTVAP